MFGFHPVSLLNCGYVAGRRVLRLRYQRLWWRFYVPIRQERRLPWCWRQFACQDHRRADNKQCGREESRRGQSGGLIAGELIAQEVIILHITFCYLRWTPSVIFKHRTSEHDVFMCSVFFMKPRFSCTITARFGRRELPAKLYSTFRKTRIACETRGDRRSVLDLLHGGLQL